MVVDFSGLQMYKSHILWTSWWEVFSLSSLKAPVKNREHFLSPGYILILSLNVLSNYSQIKSLIFSRSEGQDRL